MAATPIANCVHRNASLTRAAAGAVACTISVIDPPRRFWFHWERSGGDLVFDMPRLKVTEARSAQMTHDFWTTLFAREVRCRERCNEKKWPRTSRPLEFGRSAESKTKMLETLYRVELEPDARKIAVADRDPGACHQQAVDCRHQAAEQGAGGGQAK